MGMMGMMGEQGKIWRVAVELFTMGGEVHCSVRCERSEPVERALGCCEVGWTTPRYMIPT